MPSLFFQQVRALVRKDFQIIRVHRRKMIAELIFPIMMSCLCCFLLVQIGGQIAQFTTFSSIIDSYESGCYTNWLGFVRPWSYSQMNQLYNGTCGFQSSVGYSNNTAGIEAWIAAVNQSNGYGYGYAERAVLWSGTPDNVTLFTSPYYGRSAVLNLASALQNDLLPLASQLHLSSMMGNGLSMLQYNVYQTMATAATIMLCMVFLPMASSTAGRLVDEKRTKVREHLKVMGVSPLAYLTSSLCTSMLRILFAVLVIAVVLFGWAGSTVSPGHILTVLVVLYLYGLTISAWAHVAPAFFTKPQLSNAFMSLFIMAGVISAPFITMLEGNLIVPFALFFSPVNAMFCIAPILGKQIVTLAVSPSLCIFFAVLQVVMYSAIAEYLYAINPGDYGVPMHPLYPFMRIFQLCGLCLTREQRERQQFLAGGAKDAAGVTEHDRIVIRELVKYFGSQRDVAAVDHLSLTIRHKEIFALLGHNGAGKTTTISMLIGMIPATDYELCTIEGYDTTTEMDQIRRSIACCPQFDVLYDDLSGRQHLELFAGVKGVSAASAAESMLQRLHLPLDDQPSSTYSGGMKRRLSVGNALIGGSQVIFLDEPSSGLDPLSRRRLWGLLRDERDAGKTIVLTTHFMEEADYLGDRIAIMSHGKLVCCDTSTNLKHNYGVGYYVSVVKNPDDPARFDTPGVLALLRRHCDGQGTIHHESNADVIFLLPVSMVDRFGPMLEELESQLSFYNASSYGVAMNSLEDVFVAISEQQEAMRVGARTGVVNEHSTSPSQEKHPNATEHDTTLTDTGKSTAELFTAATYEGFFALLVFQTWAMMIKKACVWRRSLRLIFLGLVVPVLFVVAAYAAAIPKFGNQNDNNGGNYYWIPQTALMEVPTFDKPITVALYASDQGFGPRYFGDEPPAVDMQCASNLMNRFATRYAELSKAQTGVAKQLTFTYISDKNAIQNCAFYDTHSISWLAEQNFDVIIFINECSSANSNQFGWSWFYNRAYDTQVLVSLDMAMRTAATSFRFPDVATPIFYFEHLPSLVVSAPPTTGTPAPPSPQEFILVPLAVLIVMGVAQFAANTALPVADELNKKTFDTLRMHGLMASSFWLGHYVFDMLTALPFVILFIIGPSVRGIHYMAFADTISVDAFALILLVSFALLSAYAIVSMLPHGTKQSTYVVVIFLANSICLSLPFVLLAIYIAANPSVGFDSSTVEPLSFLFPQRCFMYIVTSQPKTESSWELTGTHKALASMIVWQLVPLLTLWWFSHSDLAKRYELPFAGAVPKPSSHATEAQALLSVQNARSPLLSTADVDVLREYDRIASQVAVLSGDPTAVVVAETHDVDGPVTKATSGVVPVSHDMYFVKDLRKEFHGSCIPCCGLHDKVAVQSLTFGIKRGECFGLLGPNGAGKTTSVKMMLRELVQTSGVIHCASAADATSMCDQMPPSRGALYRASRLGVCQQHDTLWDQLNAEEHMRLFLRVRLGSLYQHNDWTNYIDSALAKVQLSEGGEKASEKFSGGMKRKLSVCIAMYTGATAVFLDEPSTGMDPHARRALWKSIHEALQHDRCVLLTTHSMEEADAVCARIAIVTDGLMQCIGSSQHLKSRYGTGYSIVLTLRPIAAESGFEPSQVPNADDPRASVVDTAMGCVFGPTCVLKEALGLQRRYAVTELQSVALAFRRLAEHREAWFLENYSVTQLTSLEQIFIEFAGWSSGDN